ncbi:MAG: AraC family transcriptional regulator [Bacillota bacterium]|jgi:AraC family transcriptional activator of mtrCDE|nr:AraC family transcriptional regulator [Bacillota bacterium]
MSKQKKDIIEYRSYDLPVNFPVILLTGDRWHISDIKSGRLHFHNCLEIGICHSDEAVMEFYGVPTPIKAGNITCIPRNLPHTTYSVPGMSSLWSYIFLEPEDLFRNYIHNLELPISLLQNFPMLIMHKNTHPNVHFLVTSIINELQQKRPGFQASARGLLLALCIEFLRLQEDQAADIPAFPPENALVISPALDYIRENYANQFPISLLADLCHLSGTHFRRVFNSIMGTSPLEFLNKTRIYKACALLRSTEKTVLSISEQVGFRSVSSFNRYFIRIMGMSPRSWRTQLPQTEVREDWKKQTILEFSGWV